MNPGPVTPSRCRRASGVTPNCVPALQHLGGGLGDVRLDRQVELARVHDDPFPCRVADGVGRVRRERKREPRLVLEGVADSEPACR